MREHYGILDERVRRALGTVPRHRFVLAVDLGPASADRAIVTHGEHGLPTSSASHVEPLGISVPPAASFDGLARWIALHDRRAAQLSCTVSAATLLERGVPVLSVLRPEEDGWVRTPLVVTRRGFAALSR
ncbi:MAG: hypothetical protein M0004_05685 [Actinomycetota bacterium]|nr:hypothetical protein [Actinomycetota bacterium]